MKITAIAVVVMAGATLQARAAEPANQKRITVCMESVSGAVAGQARMLASQMFAQVGITIDWHTELSACQAQEIKISLSTATPKSLRPGALGYALPYDGVHICVFYDRILHMSDFHSVPRLLAHAMVHEITHILESVDRHSSQGIMKAHWDEDDFRYMDRQCMSFAKDDVELINAGLAARAARAASSDAVANTPATVFPAQQ